VTLIKVSLLETKTDHINVTQGFYARKAKEYLIRQDGCIMNNEC
jgi:hypothetical protein